MKKDLKVIIKGLAVLGGVSLISLAWVYASINFPTVFTY